METNASNDNGIGQCVKSLDEITHLDEKPTALAWVYSLLLVKPEVSKSFKSIMSSANVDTLKRISLRGTA